MKKILVTGTGRCGTTFLMRLFTYLDLNTGIHPNQVNRHILGECNSGMEINWIKNPELEHSVKIIKSPNFMRDISDLVERRKWEIDFIIVPIRNYEEAAKSREYFNKKAGGLTWGAKDFESQLEEFYKSMSFLIKDVVKYEIKTIFLDFEKMTTNKKYVYEKLKYLLDKNFDKFCKAYEKANSESKSKSGIWKKN